MKQSALFILFLIPFFAYTQTSNSTLASGDWYKISVEETGVHQITYNDLVGFGLDPDQIDPRQISLYGNPAGMLSETYADPSYLGLLPMAIQVIGEEDGVFNTDDYILFYGQGPVTWKYDSVEKHFYHAINYYTDETYYFLTIGQVPAKRIQTQPNSILPYTAIINFYDLLIYHEFDEINLVKSGKNWLGESFRENNIQSFNFDLSDYLIFPSNKYFKTIVAANSTEISFFDISMNDNPFAQIKMPVVPTNHSYQKYRTSTYDTVGMLNGANLKVTFKYDRPNDSSEAWLDYFELNLKMGTIFHGDQFGFRTTDNIGEDSVSYFYFNVDSPEEFVFWNVSDPLNVSLIDAQINDDNIPWFKLETENVLEFRGFNNDGFYSPGFVEQVENQDLVNFLPVGFLIITHPDFEGVAENLANFHNSSDNLSVGTVSTSEIYNEFSAGVADVSAIRNFIWHLHEKIYGSSSVDTLQYVLLLGDASYDYKDRVENNTNFIPTFESLESGNAVLSFATDRYFSVKNMYGTNQVQIAVGRIPVSTVSDANAMAAKIESYAAASTLGNRKNEIMFVADVGDQNLHQNEADYLAEQTEINSPVFNITKTYLDLFDVVQTDDGPRYPEVNAEIEQKINDGIFYVNYTGHGSTSELSQEKVLTIPELSGWDNNSMLPLWVISSAMVARYDNPDFVSLGESLFLKENAGAISVISSSGGNFASANFSLNVQVLERFVNESTQADLRFGDLFNNPIAGINDLKWTFIGDPALKIGFPKYLVEAITVNGIEIDNYSDTILPGSILKVRGQIADKAENNLQSWFNGTVYLKVYAPLYIKLTKGFKGVSVEEITVQDSILAEATAMVINGEFEIETTLPAKYFEEYGNLKLSLYAENGDTDANGFNNRLIFGGEPDAIDEFNQFADRIKVYPSPFKTQVNVELPKLKTGAFTIAVYDLMGVKVFNVNAGHNLSQKIDLSFLTEGIYLLNVSSALGSKSMKILKN